MDKKEFRYKEHLNKYSECPMKECNERDVPAFRWVYSSIASADFLPQVFSEKYPDKNLGTTKLCCEDFSLSMFDSLSSALSRYMHFYEKKTRPEAKEVYIHQRGNSIIQLNLKKEDGVSDEPNDKGHFSFFEYNDFDYSQRIDVSQIYSIFAQDDKDNNTSDL